MRPLEVRQVALSEVKRRKSWPAFDFVEFAIREGRAFRLGAEGYVLVGGRCRSCQDSYWKCLCQESFRPDPMMLPWA